MRLHQCGERDLAVLSENVNAGASRNTGADKQTYYKLSLAGRESDCVASMAEDLFRGQCVDGDLALCEAALSAKCFYHLAELGVPFPENEYGESVGYRTDHDRGRRASSAGPYTSRIMVECLEREAVSRHITILDHMQLVRLLVKDEKVYGILCLDMKKTESLGFTIIWCENVVLATGGPAGMYHDSVYPPSQLGSSGTAFLAGVKGKNLTEWQYGIASIKPRWNVSGTYMQAMPRFVSTNQQGEDEREFLADYFEDPARMRSLIFMKGYQWPFDAVGEVCGSHGVTRPGGSALNAGQVGALRAAEHIVYGKNGTRQKNADRKGTDRKTERESCRKDAWRHMERITLSAGPSNLGEIWEKAALRMSRAGGMIRCREDLEQALLEVTAMLSHFESAVRISDYRQAGMFFHLYDMLISQQVYLSAMLDYVQRGGKSRGSALYTCPDGKKPEEKMPDLYRCKLDEGTLGGMIQEVVLEKGRCRISWREVRAIPEPDSFFEIQWKEFRKRRGLENE